MLSETSVLTRRTRCKVQEDILHCCRRGNIPEDRVLRPYTVALYGETNQGTFDEETAHQQQLHGTVNKSGNQFERSSCYLSHYPSVARDNINTRVMAAVIVTYAFVMSDSFRAKKCSQLCFRPFIFL
jgi:hypothetical protein